MQSDWPLGAKVVMSTNACTALISQDGFEQRSAFYFYKGPDNKYLDWVGHPISGSTSRLRCLSVKTATDDRRWGSVFWYNFTSQKQAACLVGPWAVVCQLWPLRPLSRTWNSKQNTYKLSWNSEPFRRLRQTSMVDWGEKSHTSLKLSHQGWRLCSHSLTCFGQSNAVMSCHPDASILPCLEPVSTAMGLVSFAGGWDSMWRRILEP